MRFAAKWIVTALLATGGMGLWLLDERVAATTGAAPAKFKAIGIKGQVTDTHSRPIVGAKVYFIDSTTIDTTPITPANLISGAAQAYDEALEDIINNPALVKTVPVATTNKQGRFQVTKLNANTTYFPFVVPAASDVNHLPGGDQSRIAFSPSALPRTGLLIQVSWNFPAGATYIGPTACLGCHTDHANVPKHPHSWTIQQPGLRTALQNAADFPNLDLFTGKFTPAATYSAAGVEVLFFESYNATAANHWLIFENKTGGGPVDAKVYLWKSPDGVYHATIENVLNEKDPNNFSTFVVAALQGGVLRQRLHVNIPGRKGLYRFIAFQGYPGPSQGNNQYYDASRKVFQEASAGGGGFSSFFNHTTKLLTLPAANGTTQSCAVCHLGGGYYRRLVDPTTGETLCTTLSAATDPNGGVDLDGSGTLQMTGITCEVYHGPGSEHQAKNLLPDSGSGTHKVSTKGEFIVNPALLDNSRASLICGRCHSGGAIIDPNNFPPPGISRANYLANYVTGATERQTFWADGIHQKGGHEGMAYLDWIQAKHARNGRILVACDNCHDPHADAPFPPYYTVDDPHDPNSTLCMQCHAIDVAAHALAEAGNAMTGESTPCTGCHMTRMGKGAAGRPGLLLGTPTGAATDANLEYWENDQASHIMDVPHKFDAGVPGVPPGTAMPVPYTNSCGTCHNPASLPFQQPAQ